MACPEGERFTREMFQTAIQNFDLWEAGVCAYGTPLSSVLLATVLYGAVGLNVFIRTGSPIIPFVLFMLLGGTILAQTYAVISTFAAIIILTIPAAIVTATVYLWDRF